MTSSIKHFLLVSAGVAALTAGSAEAFFSFGKKADEAQAAAGGSASVMTREQVEGIVGEYLEKNPEVVVKALESMQRREMEKAATKARENIDKNADALLKDPMTPVIGNPDGDITVVEFFDYNCGYCKRALGDVLKLVENDKNVRVVLKEFPILGESSRTMAEVSLGVYVAEPEKYLAFHQALMKYAGAKTRQKLVALAGTLGVDTAKLEGVLKEKKVVEALAKNTSLARELGVRGTPAFVIGKELVPGAAGYNHLQSLVDKERKGAEEGS